MREPKESTELDLSQEVKPASAATEEDLGVLHGAVAKVLTEAVWQAPSPAYLGAAIAFLKNNSITASPSSNKDLAALKDALAAKRKRGDLKKPDFDAAVASFEEMQGKNGLMQ